MTRPRTDGKRLPKVRDVVDPTLPGVHRAAFEAVRAVRAGDPLLAPRARADIAAAYRQAVAVGAA
ncbi:hypothetical protein [Actinokineospora terrae]|uniref:hypothetical protein n=1 Tax=Actinokineospora terrae TaxID=155974 RepID=UPI00116021AE|nr:hypothetical protein [Actinokineospora terrae]